jgi:hypothetical protein
MANAYVQAFRCLPFAVYLQFIPRHVSGRYVPRDEVVVALIIIHLLRFFLEVLWNWHQVRK